MVCAMDEQSPSARWTLQESLVAILFLAASADGGLDKVEQAEILALQRRSKSFQALKPLELTALNLSVVNRVRYGGSGLAQACAALSAEARLPAFALALDLMLSDGELTDGEADFVKKLTLHLSLESDAVAKITEVMALRHRI
jgi:tellurite resistance protein